jgi:hypothetical protein
MMKIDLTNKRGAGLDYEGLHLPSTLLLAARQLQPWMVPPVERGSRGHTRADWRAALYE